MCHSPELSGVATYNAQSTFFQRHRTTTGWLLYFTNFSVVNSFITIMSCTPPLGLPSWFRIWNQSGFTGAGDSEWHWHQVGHMQISTSPQIDN